MLHNRGVVLSFSNKLNKSETIMEPGLQLPIIFIVDHSIDYFLN